MENNDRLILEQNKLIDVLRRLEELLADPIDSHKAIVDATIQRFKFTYELFWRWLRLVIKEEGVEVNFPKAVLKEAYKAGMINNEEIWLKMLKDRSLTSHAYNEDLAISIYDNIKTYASLIKEVLEKYKQ